MGVGMRFQRESLVEGLGALFASLGLALAGGGTGAIVRTLLNAVSGRRAQARRRVIETYPSESEIELFGETPPRTIGPVARVGEINSEPTAEPGLSSGELQALRIQPQVNPEPVTPTPPAIGDRKAVRREQQRQKKAAEKAAKLEGEHVVKAPGSSLSVGYRVDGVPDILNFIEAEGGIMPPSELKRRGHEIGGEYDFFNHGIQGLLRRKAGPTMGRLLAAGSGSKCQTLPFDFRVFI